MAENSDIDDVSADEAEADLGVNEVHTLTKYRKSAIALIGAVVTLAGIYGVDIGAVVTLAGIYGVDIDPELVAAVTTLVTASLVWWVPNAA
jgi:hypothetical protein